MLKSSCFAAALIFASMPADAAQTSQDVAQMAAKDAAIRVELVYDDIAQIFKELGPPRMMRKDA